MGQLYFWLYLNKTLKDIMFIKEQGDTWKNVIYLYMKLRSKRHINMLEKNHARWNDDSLLETVQD